MKESIRAIEKHLQEFFESRFLNLGGKDLFQEITEKLVDMFQKIREQRDPLQLAPNIIRIKINNKDIAKEALQDFSDTLKLILRDYCLQESLQLPGPLHIQFFKDQRINETFAIDTAYSSSSSKTTNIFTSPEPKEALQHKIEGYLITPTDQIYIIQNKITNIGRKDDNELVIDNFLVSRLHAQIREINGRHILFDIDSAAGTKVNGRPVRQHALLPGDVIEIADISLIYYSELDEKTHHLPNRLTRKIQSNL